MGKAAFSGIVLLLSAACWAQEPSLRFVEEGGSWRVAVEGTGGARLVSPEEGLWSVAAGWVDDWPAGWIHARPETLETVGEWTLLSGTLKMAAGEWRLRDAYRAERGLVRCTRRWEWTGKRPAEKCTLSVRFLAPGGGRGVVLPGVLYHGNPSGAASGRVPAYTGAAGEEAFFEEHRFPMPFASLEWPGADGFLGAALHTVPAPVPCGHLPDQWWSLGVAARDGTTEFALLSGPCAANGKRGVIKAVQPGFIPYPDAWLTVPPGTVIEKTFYLDAYGVAAEGSGFRRPVHAALRMHAPYSSGGMPAFSDILRGKSRYAETRWRERGTAAGFSKYPDKDILVMGWCGQADAPGYALQVLPDTLSPPDGRARAQKALDFLSTAEFYDGGFHTWYHLDTGKWDHHEPLSQAQAMLSFANAVRVGRANGMNTSKWEDFLRRACDFHAGRILDASWNPKSTDEAFFVAPLCAARALFGEERFLEAARKAGDAYAARSVSMREPYWGGTLDASCEDKEGAFAALQAFLALHDATGDEKYLEWARHACDVVLTYVVVWDMDLPAGRLRDHAFKTRGWTAVSPQNMHIDAFGVLIAPLVRRLGDLTDDGTLRDLSLLMYRSCGQLMDPHGSQGEQPMHTNYAQRGEVNGPHGLRGGYIETWTVFWLTAHFLNAAAQFAEMGVLLE